MCDMNHPWGWHVLPHSQHECVTNSMWISHEHHKHTGIASLKCATLPVIHMCDMNSSCVWYGKLHSYVWYDSFICVTPTVIPTCGMTHSYVWLPQFFIRVVWLIHMCDSHSYSYVWPQSFICVTWVVHVRDMARVCLIHTCGMTHSEVWLYTVLHTCDMIHSCVWHDSFMCVTGFVHVRDMIHSCVWHGEGIPHS